MKKAVWIGITVNFLLAAAINIIYFNQQINLLLIGVTREENIKSPLWVFAIFIMGTAVALCIDRIHAQEMITDEGIYFFKVKIPVYICEEKRAELSRDIQIYLRLLIHLLNFSVFYQLICVLFQEKFLGNMVGNVVIFLLLFGLVVLLYRTITIAAQSVKYQKK